MMSKQALIWIVVALLVFLGGWSLHIQFVVVLQDLPFLALGFLGGWFVRSRWKPNLP